MMIENATEMYFSTFNGISKIHQVQTKVACNKAFLVPLANNVNIIKIILKVSHIEILVVSGHQFAY